MVWLHGARENAARGGQQTAKRNRRYRQYAGRAPDFRVAGQRAARQYAGRIRESHSERRRQMGRDRQAAWGEAGLKPKFDPPQINADTRGWSISKRERRQSDIRHLNLSVFI